MGELYTPPATAVNTAPVRSTRLISAQSIAKAHWGPRQRAREAAAWVSGRAQIKATVALASTVFNVSEPLIHDALKREKNVTSTLLPTALFHLGWAWDRATPAERAAFGRPIGVNIVWDDAVAPNLA